MKFEVKLSSLERVIIEAFAVKAEGDFAVFQDNSGRTTAAIFRPVAVIGEGAHARRDDAD